jgi:hypothetical protein
MCFLYNITYSQKKKKKKKIIIGLVILDFDQIIILIDTSFLDGHKMNFKNYSIFIVAFLDILKQFVNQFSDGANTL